MTVAKLSSNGPMNVASDNTSLRQRLDDIMRDNSHCRSSEDRQMTRDLGTYTNSSSL